MKKEEPCGACESAADEGPESPRNESPRHPHHRGSKQRLNRAKGQLEAVGRMIDERRYCPEIIYQIRAATNALKSLENEVLRGHLRGCVKEAFQSKDPFEIESKIDEILKLTSAN